VAKIGLTGFESDRFLSVPIQTEDPNDITEAGTQGLGRLLFDRPWRKLAIAHRGLQAVAPDARVNVPEHVARAVCAVLGSAE
jgi:hypothetical protein